MSDSLQLGPLTAWLGAVLAVAVGAGSVQVALRVAVTTVTAVETDGTGVPTSETVV